MLILKKFKIYKKKFLISNFCSKNTEKLSSLGLSKSGSKEEAQIGKNMEYKEKFFNKESKKKREEFLKREITSNPEFFKAFPHLSQIVKSVNEIDEDIPEYVKENFFIPEKLKQHNKKNENYFESLL